ncbi:MAG: hypothetical protein U0531_09820 [Dehalococcoidia bacterium]
MRTRRLRLTTLPPVSALMTALVPARRPNQATVVLRTTLPSLAVAPALVRFDREGTGRVRL